MLGVTGCGYRLIGARTTAPGGVRSVSIGVFQNETREFGLERNLAFAFEREIYRRGLLRLEDDPGAGEGILSGTIREFKTRPVAFDTEDEALEYEAELTVEVTLRRQDDGEVLWQSSSLQALEEYSVNKSIVVPSAARFQLETTDFRDLQNLTDIQLAESQKRLAIERMVETIVRDVHDRILDDF
jgi:hypothetical protein